MLALPRRFSDQRHLVLKCLAPVYGPIPFKCFKSWFSKPGFVEVVTKAYSETVGEGPPNKRFMLKLKAIKIAIKVWRKHNK